MTDYIKGVDFRRKDDLAVRDPNKVISGAEFDQEFSAIESAIASKAEVVPVFPDLEPDTPYFADAESRNNVNQQISIIPSSVDNTFHVTCSFVKFFNLGVAGGGLDGFEQESIDQGTLQLLVINNDTDSNAIVSTNDNTRYSIIRGVEGGKLTNGSPPSGGSLNFRVQRGYNVHFLSNSSFRSLVGFSSSGYTLEVRYVNSRARTIAFTGAAQTDFSPNTLQGYKNIAVKEINSE